MKQYLSVLMLFARSTFYKLLGLLALAGIAEIILFYDAAGAAFNLEEAVSISHLSTVCALLLVLWAAVLVRDPLRKGGYTMCRLALTRKQIFLCRTVYSLLTLVILWGFQTCLLMGLFTWFGTQHPDPMIFGPQSILLAFYRNEFLHSMLPLADWTRYLRNLLLTLAAASLVSRPMTRWQGTSRFISVFLLLFVGIKLFPMPTGSRTADIILMAVSAVTFAITMALVDNEEELDGGSTTYEVPASPLFEEGGNGGAL